MHKESLGLTAFDKAAFDCDAVSYVQGRYCILNILNVFVYCNILQLTDWFSLCFNKTSSSVLLNSVFVDIIRR